MKWLAISALAALAAVTVPVSAQTILPIGNIAQISDTSPSNWAYSGYNIFRITSSDGQETPIMRTETYDARTVEILSRAQVPPVSAQDVKVINGNEIVVRRYLLMRVTPQDARAEGTTVSALAHKWARSVGNVLPKIAPLPNRLGV